MTPPSDAMACFSPQVRDFVAKTLREFRAMAENERDEMLTILMRADAELYGREEREKLTKFHANRH